MKLDIRPGDFDDPRVRALLQVHVSGMLADTPPGLAYVLDLSGLQRPDISFFAAWDGETLAGIGALKALDAATGELKSMRAAETHLRKGVGRALLEHLITLARARGYQTLCLETGSAPSFAPAIALYTSYGFKPGPAFGEYQASDFNQFFYLDLGGA